ncbi:uncharacterized protein LOC141641965 isoform X2 [Silene latifolia]|uniref:uncharacterized protein LOC141641965 isoform X2 n=1 Tax=Silene latifolia TaxID=37657 RepID=UPI003D782BEF
MRHARGEKRGVKRDRSVSSSVGSSTTPPSAKARKIKSGLNGMGWDNGAYTSIFLNLLQQKMACLFEGLNNVEFWKSFTDRLNALIKESLPPYQKNFFENFAVREIIEYVKSCKNTYTTNKDEVDADQVISHFPLYRAVFQRWDHRVHSFPSLERLLGIKRKRSKSSGSGLSSELGIHSTWENLIDPITTELELDIHAAWENLVDPITTELELDIRAAWENLVDPITTELGSLVNKRRITPSQSALALANFRNDVCLGLLWLKMTTPKKLQYIAGVHQARYSM